MRRTTLVFGLLVVSPFVFAFIVLISRTHVPRVPVVHATHAEIHALERAFLDACGVDTWPDLNASRVDLFRFDVHIVYLSDIRLGARFHDVDLPANLWADAWSPVGLGPGPSHPSSLKHWEDTRRTPRWIREPQRDEDGFLRFTGGGYASSTNGLAGDWYYSPDERTLTIYAVPLDEDQIDGSITAALRQARTINEHELGFVGNDYHRWYELTLERDAP